MNIYTFGKLSNSKYFISVAEDSIIIKNGGLSFFGVKGATSEIIIKKENITSIAIETPITKPNDWKFIISQTSGNNFIIPIATVKQKKNAEIIKNCLMK